MTNKFTTSEVREVFDGIRTGRYAHRSRLVQDMLHAYADRLEADEKAVPVAYEIDDAIEDDADYWDFTLDTGGPAKYVNKASFDQQVHKTDDALATVSALTTDAERLAEQRDDAFQQAVQEARRVWMDEFPCEAGHDHVTPFDQFLYGNRPCMEAQPPAAIKQREQDKKDAARYRWLLRDVGRAVDLLTDADLEGTPAYEIGDAIESAMAKESGR